VQLGPRQPNNHQRPPARLTEVVIVFGRRPCPAHDTPSARRIAQLEVETGIDPDAVTNYEANATSFAEAFANPDIVDCGRPRCRERRW
jgi:hypothetical protein